MSGRDELNSLRPGRSELERLALAIGLSLFAHLAVFGGYQVAKRTDLSAMLRERIGVPPVVKKMPAAEPKEDPLIFVDVSRASADMPDKAKYYSDRHSRAANPDSADANTVKLAGTQPDVPKTESVPRANQLQPAPPKPASPEVKPVVAPPPGALQVARPEKAAKPEQAQPERPRTVKQALDQQKIPGQQMKQPGGVQRHALSPSFDVKATPFGAYDRALVDAVTTKWYALLDSQRFAQDRTGKATVRFHLNSDGSVTDLKVVETTVGDILSYVCRESIAQAAPFGKWPPEMRRLIGENFREITFTFYYY